MLQKNIKKNKNICILTKTWTISFMAEPREKVKHRTGGQRSSSTRWKEQSSSKRWKHIVTKAESRFSAKEGASRSDQARPKTNMQVSLLTIILSGFEAEKKDDCYKCYQTLDGRFGDGKSEAHGKYSAKEGVRPNQARPQTNIKVDLFLVILAQLWSFADPWREVWRWKKRSPRKI